MVKNQYLITCNKSVYFIYIFYELCLYVPFYGIVLWEDLNRAERIIPPHQVYEVGLLSDSSRVICWRVDPLPLVLQFGCHYFCLSQFFVYNLWFENSKLEIFRL